MSTEAQSFCNQTLFGGTSLSSEEIGDHRHSKSLKLH